MSKYKNIQTLENYASLLESGMFWVYHPELTGNWHEDINIIKLKDDKKKNN